MYFCEHCSSCGSRGQRSARKQRALRCSPGTISRAVREIGERRDQRSLIVREAAQPEVALAAEQAAYPAGHMAMIDAQRFLRRLPADRAHAALSLQQRVVFRP
jgi:hypothetical protein